MLAPVIDAEAPAGYVRSTFAAAERQRREAEVAAAIGRLIYAIECRYGARVAQAARRHFEPVGRR